MQEKQTGIYLARICLENLLFLLLVFESQTSNPAIFEQWFAIPAFELYIQVPRIYLRLFRPLLQVFECVPLCFRYSRKESGANGDQTCFFMALFRY